DAVLLIEVKTNECLDRIVLPTGQPREREHPRPPDLAVDAVHSERFAANTNAAHEPSAFAPQVRLHVYRLEPALPTPPLYAFLWAGQRGKHPFRPSFDRDFLGNRVDLVRLAHGSSSTYFLRSRRVSFQKAS